MKKASGKSKITFQKQFEILEQSLVKQINRILVSNLNAAVLKLSEKLNKKLDEETFVKYKDEILTSQDRVAARVKKMDVEQDVIAFKVKQHEERLQKLENPPQFLSA